MDCNTFSADQLFYARKSPVFDQKLKEQKLKSTTLTHFITSISVLRSSVSKGRNYLMSQ